MTSNNSRPAGGDAQVTGIVSSGEDITARRPLEDELGSNARGLHSVLEAMSEGLLILEIIFSDTGKPRDLRLIEANPAFERQTGLKRVDSVGHTLLDVFPQAELSWVERFGKVGLTGEATTFDALFEPLQRHFHFSAFQISRGQVGVILTDVSERKRAEEEMARTLSLLESTMESTADGILVADGKGGIVRFNTQFTKMWGIPEAIVAGRDDNAALAFVLDQLKEPDDFVRTVRELYDAPTEVSFDVLEFKDGRIIERYSQPQRIGDDIVGRVWSFRDVTARNQAEAENVRLEAQFQQNQKMESIGRLAGGVAHDFNNMLGVILGHTEMALDQVDPADPLHASLGEIHKAGKRSADLTRQLLAFARKQTVTPRVLDLNKIVAGMLEMLQRLIGEDKHLTCQHGVDLWSVKMDPSQVEQSVTNLCLNARDAIDGDGTIVIETGNSVVVDMDGVTPGEYVRLAISDDGCGMDAETLAHVFEPFFTTKGVGRGTGLGLATVYGAVSQNGGFIQTRSKLGSGSTFTMYLPRHVGKREVASTEATAGGLMRGDETILVVEDEPAILKLTKAALERQGYAVLAAGTPGEAIRLASEHRGVIHLLVTDVVMPEMNGRTLARRLRLQHPQVKRLFMSGYTADVIAHHGVVDEGISFLQKPFSVNDLATKVRESLDRE